MPSTSVSVISQSSTNVASNNNGSVTIANGINSNSQIILPDQLIQSANTASSAVSSSVSGSSYNLNGINNGSASVSNSDNVIKSIA